MAAAEIDLGPADPLPDDSDAKVHCRGEIGLQMAVVAGGGDVVFPLVIFPDEGGAFKARHEEGGKDRVARRRHVSHCESPFVAAFSLHRKTPGWNGCSGREANSM